jgi:hypothetical protein
MKNVALIDRPVQENCWRRADASHHVQQESHHSRIENHIGDLSDHRLFRFRAIGCRRRRQGMVGIADPTLVVGKEGL